MVFIDKIMLGFFCLFFNIKIYLKRKKCMKNKIDLSKGVIELSLLRVFIIDGWSFIE